MSQEQANRLLYDGAWKGKLNRIKRALAAGADINSRSYCHKGHWNALQLAALGGNPQCLQYLIDHGAKLRSQVHSGCTALHCAAYEISDYEQSAQILLEAVLNDSRTALHYA